LSRCAELYAATPVVDQGAELLIHQVEPFRVAKVQVEGVTQGLTVFRQYSWIPMIIPYVHDPLGESEGILLSGTQAWDLPIDYVARGGRASDHHPANSLLDEYRAPSGRWQTLFSETAAPPSGLFST